MDPVSIISDEVRRHLPGGIRLLGPILAQAGLISLINDWGGRPTDALARLATFLGLVPTWIENIRAWVDAPARHESLTPVIGAVAGLLLLSMAYHAGRWLSGQRAERTLVTRAKTHEDVNTLYDRWGQYEVARTFGTGMSLWLCIAFLLELQALNLALIAFCIAAYAILGLVLHFWDRLDENAPIEIGTTALSLTSELAMTMGFTLLAPELRLMGSLMLSPNRQRS